MADVWERAYAAGLFDGEGCVQIYMRGDSSRTRNCLRTALSVSGVDLRPLFWLRERYGGTIKVEDRSHDPVRRDLGNWVIYSFQAETFANDILPYLLVKREQVDLWLYARSLTQRRGHTSALTPEQEAERMKVVRLAKELKRHR